MNLSLSAPQKPAALRKGQTIGLIAPSSALLEPERLPKCVEALEDAGYRVKTHESCVSRDGYLAGPDALRADAVNRMFMDDQIDAIFCVRGGYGATRILPCLRYDAIRQNPKIFTGYSDATALHSALLTRANIVTFHGLMAVPDFARDEGPDPFSMESFFRAVSDPSPTGFLKNPDGRPLFAVASGQAVGPLIGGNLSLVASCVGTPYAYRFDGAVLFLEDVNEKLYAVDRMLHQLKNAGVFDRCAAILLGAFTGCESGRPDADERLLRLFNDLFGGLRVPVLSGLQCGHLTPKLTLPFGVSCKVDTGSRTVEILEGAVRP